MGGPQSDYSVCPRPLRRVFYFSGFWVSGFRVFGVSGFRGFRFSGFQVFGDSGFRGFGVSGFRGFEVSGFQVFRTGRDARFYGRDGTRSSTIRIIVSLSGCLP